VIRKIPRQRLITTFACLTEMMYFAGRLNGIDGQRRVWEYIDKGLLIVDGSATPNWDRMRELMEKYADQPMDFADATLVCAAEVLDLDTVFSLDQHFYAYRMHGRKPFHVIP
jgi:predicted nucleic acid-binding protein